MCIRSIRVITLPTLVRAYGAGNVISYVCGGGGGNFFFSFCFFFSFTKVQKVEVGTRYIPKQGHEEEIKKCFLFVDVKSISSSSATCRTDPSNKVYIKLLTAISTKGNHCACYAAWDYLTPGSNLANSVKRAVF